jgi:NADPH:quinone reductase-like Zn-dependent oxidoreductase
VFPERTQPLLVNVAVKTRMLRDPRRCGVATVGWVNRTATMTAAVTVRHGGPEVIEIRSDWPVPEVGTEEARVRVTAAALNNTDIWSREGSYGTSQDPAAVAGWKGVPLEFPRIQGIDIAGVVDSVGAGVDPAWTGRRVVVDPTVTYAGDFPVDVVGSEVDGGFAQFHVCSVQQLHDVTDSPLSDAQLSCLPTAYGTALGMINRARCSAGERVLVTGSSGGVGSAAIQLLVNRGCHVVARTSPSKVAAVEALGVSEVSVRGQDSLSEIDEVDAVIDVVGGEEFDDLIDRLCDGGRLATAGAIAGPMVTLDLRRLYLRQRTVIGSTMHSPSDFAELARIASVGGVRPHVHEVFPLERLHDAQRRFESKAFTGKLVVAPHGPENAERVRSTPHVPDGNS